MPCGLISTFSSKANMLDSYNFKTSFLQAPGRTIHIHTPTSQDRTRITQVCLMSGVWGAFVCVDSTVLVSSRLSTGRRRTRTNRLSEKRPDAQSSYAYDSTNKHTEQSVEAFHALLEEKMEKKVDRREPSQAWTDKEQGQGW